MSSRWLWLLCVAVVAGFLSSGCDSYCDYVPEDEYCKGASTSTGETGMETETDADADADSDSDTDSAADTDTGDSTVVTDTGTTSDTGDCVEEQFDLIDGVHRATVCAPNLLDPASAFTVPTSPYSPGVGQWSVISLIGWELDDLGPSPVSWPTLGSLWSMAVLNGTPAADGGLLTNECVSITLDTDPALSYAINLTARSTAPANNLLGLYIDEVEVAQVVVPPSQPYEEMFIGFGYFEGLSRPNIKICSGFTQGGVNLAKIQVREADID